jgi:acyl-CoA dehydrogenase family member 9
MGVIQPLRSEPKRRRRLRPEGGAIEAATADGVPAATECSSFSKALFLGEIHEGLVFPWPEPDPSEQDRIRRLIAAVRELADSIDPRRIEEERWVGDKLVRELGERGLCGLYVPEEYGGQGLSQTGYARVFETFTQIDATLSIVMGVHQSIGFKGIAMFGTTEQKERFLPDLASGRKLAGFALTEPNAGSDAYNIESRAVRESDGSWRLNGEKRYIGNGGVGSVFTTFARCEVDGKDRHIALIVEKGMKGFEVGERYDTMGLRGNDLRRLYFRDVRVPAENVLGEPGDGFRVAMEVLNNGRIGLGTGSVGAAKGLLDRILDHVVKRRQFGAPLADLELVEDKIGWMVSYLFGLESLTYLTCGLVDEGVPDYSLESAMSKVAGTEFLWYAANRVMQLKGGEGYMRDQPYERILRDIRIFPIFEGANDVLRSFIALSGMKPLGEELSEVGSLDLGDPIGTLGVLIDYVGGRIQREVRPARVTAAHAELKRHADAVSDQVKELRGVSESLLRAHGREIVRRGFQHKRIADALADIYAQIAVLSRVGSIFEHHGVEPSGQERYIAETFCTRAADRVRARFDQIERNDDERMSAIARLAYRRGEYGYALFED